MSDTTLKHIITDSTVATLHSVTYDFNIRIEDIKIIYAYEFMKIAPKTYTPSLMEYLQSKFDYILSVYFSDDFYGKETFGSIRVSLNAKKYQPHILADISKEIENYVLTAKEFLEKWNSQMSDFSYVLGEKYLQKQYSTEYKVVHITEIGDAVVVDARGFRSLILTKEDLINHDVFLSKN